MRKNQSAKKRRTRVRSMIKKVSDRPRLVVFRSNKHIYAQIINDSKNATLISFSDLDLKPESKDEILTRIQIAEKVGEEIAQKAIKKGVVRVVFDRGEYKYHGMVKSLAEGARKKGLDF